MSRSDNLLSDGTLAEYDNTDLSATAPSVTWRQFMLPDEMLDNGGRRSCVTSNANNWECLTLCDGALLITTVSVWLLAKKYRNTEV